MQNILLVTHNENDRHLFIEALHEVQPLYDCFHAGSGEQAINMLDFILPDFVIVDFNLPKMNGLACLSEIKKTERMQSVPVILYSNTIDDNLVKNAMKFGAVVCVKKSNKVSTLAAILQRILTMRTELKIFLHN